MNFKQIFFAKKNEYTPNEKWLNLLQTYKKEDKSIYLFYEADDDRIFYKKFIEIIFDGREINNNIVNNKDNVYKVHSLINWNLYAKNRILFFADKDYDDILGKARANDYNIFVTKYYSIENYLVNEEMFRHVLIRVFATREGTILNETAEKFNRLHSNFKNAMLPLIACILIYRRTNEHIDLDNIDLNNFFHISEFTLKNKKYYRSDIANKLRISDLATDKKAAIVEQKKLTLLCTDGEADQSKSTWQSILSNVRILQGIDDEKVYLRGKYEFWLFLTVIKLHLKKEVNKIIAQLNLENTGDMKHTNVTNHMEINERNIFDLLAPNLVMPEDIRNFLTLNRDK